MALLNPNLRGFYETDAIYYILYGGRMSGKTYHTAGFFAFLSDNYKVKFLCVRQFQNRIDDSVYTVIKDAIEREGMQDRFKFTINSIVNIYTGSEFLFYGIQRNIKEIKGVANVDFMWIEEAEALTIEQWKTIEPTILRNEGARITVVFNPRYATDFAYQRFVVNPPPNSIVRKINYDENPFLSETAKTVIEAAKSDDDFEHIYLGIPLANDDAVIIKRSWIESAIDAHLRWDCDNSGAHKLGFDIADDGGDKCAIIYAHGSVAMWGDEWAAGEDELLKSCSRAYDAALSRNAKIVYDSIGVGASAGAKFDELNTVRKLKVQYAKFNSGGSVFKPDGYYAQDKLEKIKNKDFFSNIKAQAWWLLADRFRKTHDFIQNGTQYPIDEMISISSDMPQLEKLKTELSTPKRDFDNNGRVKVESKKDLAKRDVKSPNLADAFVMAYAPINTPMRINNAVISQFMR